MRRVEEGCQLAPDSKIYSNMRVVESGPARGGILAIPAAETYNAKFEFLRIGSEVDSAGGPMTQYAAVLERALYRGWDAFRLTNGLVSLWIAPDIGGRAIQLQLDEHEFLYVNSALAGKVLPLEQNNVKSGWANYGGDKVWPAPQGQYTDHEWPGPPDYTIEGSRFAAEVVADSPAAVAVRVSSPHDQRTGIQFFRTFHVCADTTCIKVDQMMRNISDRTIRWAIWHVMQHDATDAHDPSKPNPELCMYVPLRADRRAGHGTYVMFGDARHPSFQFLCDEKMLKVHYEYRAGKIGVDTDRGWIAVANGQKEVCFVENFTYARGAEYPDHASVECWVNGPGTVYGWHEDMVFPHDPRQIPYLMESEILSPLAQLAPGEVYNFPVAWYATRAPNPIVDATEVGVVCEALRAEWMGGRVRLKGTFGVFLPGTAEAAFFTKFGEEVGRLTIQHVDPRQVFRLHKEIPLPPGAYRISLLVRDSMGRHRGVLGDTSLS